MIVNVFRERTFSSSTVAILIGTFCLSLAQAEPRISAVEGEFLEGQTVTLRGSGFSEKANPMPLFWWTADGGKAPSSLGRIAEWTGGYSENNEVSREIVAPGSSQSVRYNHQLSGIALGYVNYESDRLYVWRKKYDDFKISRDFAIRTRIRVEQGDAPAVGQTVTGLTSRASGVVQLVREDAAAGRWSVFYENDRGTVGEKPPLDFVAEETIEWPGGRGTVSGLLRTFNFKTFRLWSVNETGERIRGSSAVITAQMYKGGEYNYIVENVTGTRSIGLYQTEGAWNIEQLLLRESSNVGVQDGVLWFSVKNEWPSRNTIVTRNAQHPYPHGRLIQSQVSNGAQPNSWAYYDSLYMDESWHRVLLSSQQKWKNARDVEIQVPSAWNDSSLQFQLRFGSLDPTGPMFVYVVDSEGNVNAEGYPVSCPECPQSPEGSVR